jgi:hypothetical protein
LHRASSWIETGRGHVEIVGKSDVATQRHFRL